MWLSKAVVVVVQCDQMARLLFNIRPFTTIKKIQKHKNWAKHFTEYENNLKKLAKYFEIFAKVAKFR